MKHSQLWLLALLSILTFMTASTVMAAEDVGHASGSWELGMSGINTDDNAARVNEYGSVRAEDSIALAPKLDLEFKNGDFLLEAKSETMGPRDQMHELSIDAGRVFQLESSLNVLEHHKDHETLSQMGGTLADDLGGGQPSVTTDQIFLDTGATTIGGLDANGSDDNYDYATAIAQEADNDYIVTRREWKNEAELVVPQLANVTFKAGARIETREGMEQAISLSKCTSCHISAEGKDINERTEEFTVGATGKFGLLTVDYEYMTRNFDEDAENPSRFYASTPAGYKSDILLYNGDQTDYARTPDSEKDSHLLKARIDLPRQTSVTASYVKADIESSKEETQGEYTLLEGDELKSEFESFSGKLATSFAQKLHMSLRASTYEIEVDNNRLLFDINDTYDDLEVTADERELVSAEEREVTTVGTDLTYRLAQGTSLRLGYEYEEIKREEEELGETETHTFNAAINSRINSKLSGRLSYEYQDIDEPMSGADVGIYQGATDGGGGLNYSVIDANGLYYDVVYPERTLESTNQPDEVHELKLNTTYSMSSQMAATLFARIRYQENNSVDYEQTSYVPGISFWYAPNDKVNLTMLYTYNSQDTENKACVGWYHG